MERGGELAWCSISRAAGLHGLTLPLPVHWRSGSGRGSSLNRSLLLVFSLPVCARVRAREFVSVHVKTVCRCVYFERPVIYAGVSA